MRLIDADEVLKAEFAIEEDGAIGCVVDSEVIRRSPTIDPESLRPQGKWEWREEWEMHHETRSCDLISCGWYCTQCGIELGEYLTKETGVNIILDLDIRRPTLAVCPNCGAKMKGGNT